MAEATEANAVSIDRTIYPTFSSDVREIDDLVSKLPNLSEGLFSLLKLGLPFYSLEVDNEPAEGTNTFAARYELAEWLKVLLRALRALDGKPDEIESGASVCHGANPLANRPEAAHHASRRG